MVRESYGKWQEYLGSHSLLCLCEAHKLRDGLLLRAGVSGRHGEVGDSGPRRQISALAKAARSRWMKVGKMQIGNNQGRKV